MFGHHPLLERKLRKEGRRAPAKIREAKRTHWTETVGSDAVVADTSILWKLVLQVEPEGEPPFRAEVDELFGQMASPSPGADYSLMVLYDPHDHSKIVVDHSEEGYRLLGEILQKQRTDARVGVMRERGQDTIADRYAKIHDPALGLFGEEGLSIDPDERKKQLEERRAKIKEIMAGETADDRLALIRESQAGFQDKLEALEGALSAQDVLVGGQPAQLGAAAGPAATADALTKLADLRDRGVLNDDEFQAQKKKLLGE
jgi:hypothetical protein